MPSIWLCLQCRRCSEACSQLVDGSQVIQGLRELVFYREGIDGGFTLRLEQSHHLIYPRLVVMIDTVFGFEIDHSSQDRIAAGHS